MQTGGPRSWNDVGDVFYWKGCCMTNVTARVVIEPDMLAPQHRAELEVGSAIDSVVIAERGYFSASTPAEVPDIFADFQRRPGLGIPIRDTTGAIATYRLKDSTPDSLAIVHPTLLHEMQLETRGKILLASRSHLRTH